MCDVLRRFFSLQRQEKFTTLLYNTISTSKCMSLMLDTPKKKSEYTFFESFGQKLIKINKPIAQKFERLYKAEITFKRLASFVWIGWPHKRDKKKSSKILENLWKNRFFLYSWGQRVFLEKCMNNNWKRDRTHNLKISRKELRFGFCS